MPETDSPSFEPGTPGEMQPPAQPVSLSPRPLLSPSEIDWSAGGAAVLLAGILSGIGFFLPLGLIWVVVGGGLAVWLYNRRRPPYTQITSGTGAKLGAVTGVVGYLLFAIVAVLGLTFASERIWSELTIAMKERVGPNPDASVQQMFETMKTAEGKAILAVFVMAFIFAIFLLLGTLGGTIGAAVVRRDQHPRG
jgi:hypothetical protein